MTTPNSRPTDRAGPSTSSAVRWRYRVTTVTPARSGRRSAPRRPRAGRRPAFGGRPRIGFAPQRQRARGRGPSRLRRPPRSQCRRGERKWWCRRNRRTRGCRRWRELRGVASLRRSCRPRPADRVDDAVAERPGGVFEVTLRRPRAGVDDDEDEQRREATVGRRQDGGGNGDRAARGAVGRADVDIPDPGLVPDLRAEDLATRPGVGLDVRNGLAQQVHLLRDELLGRRLRCGDAANDDDRLPGGEAHRGDRLRRHVEPDPPAVLLSRLPCAWRVLQAETQLRALPHRPEMERRRAGGLPRRCDARLSGVGTRRLPGLGLGEVRPRDRGEDDEQDDRAERPAQPPTAAPRRLIAARTTSRECEAARRHRACSRAAMVGSAAPRPFGSARSAIPHSVQNLARGVAWPQFAHVTSPASSASMASSTRPRWMTRRSQSSARTVRIASTAAATACGSTRRAAATTTNPAAATATATAGLPIAPSALRSRTGARYRSHSAPPTPPISAPVRTGVRIPADSTRSTQGRVAPCGCRPVPRSGTASVRSRAPTNDTAATVANVAPSRTSLNLRCRSRTSGPAIIRAASARVSTTPRTRSGATRRTFPSPGPRTVAGSIGTMRRMTNPATSPATTPHATVARMTRRGSSSYRSTATT